MQTGPIWLNRLILVGILLLVVLMVLAASGPWNGMTTAAPLLAGTPTPDVYFFAGTPYPAEMLESREQTSGIILGGVMLVLIVVIGTLTVIQTRPKPPK